MARENSTVKPALPPATTASTSVREDRSHSRTEKCLLSFSFLLRLPLARVLPSGENATEETQLVCPSGVRADLKCPVSTSHSRIAWS